MILQPVPIPTPCGHLVNRWGHFSSDGPGFKPMNMFVSHTPRANSLTLFDTQFYYFQNNIVNDIICFKETGRNQIK